MIFGDFTTVQVFTEVPTSLFQNYSDQYSVLLNILIRPYSPTIKTFVKFYHNNIYLEKKKTKKIQYYALAIAIHT